MKFIVLTNPNSDNHFIEELINSKLMPLMVVTDNPFYYESNNPIKYLIKKTLLILRYCKNKSEIRKKYQPYFLARANGIPVWPPHKVNTDKFENVIKKMDLDYIFIFLFRVIHEKIFNVPKYGSINFHPALLPFNRGITPSNWVIIQNQAKTGITFHYVTKAIDGGDIIEQYEIPLSGYETSGILNGYLFKIAAILYVRLIFKLTYNIELKPLKNEVKKGSYEPQFKTVNFIIPNDSSFPEIDKLVRASLINGSSVFYNHKSKDYHIINCIDISAATFDKNIVYPFFDDLKNIVVKTRDEKTVLLVVKKNADDTDLTD